MEKRAVVDVARQITPPLLWRIAKRTLGIKDRVVKPDIPEDYRDANYQGVTTKHNARPMHVGRFADIYEQHQPLDPYVPLNVTRYRIYNLCYFANLCRNIEGDFVVAGVSFGVGPRVIYDFVEFPMIGKTFHFIDPFMGIDNSEQKNKIEKYNDNFTYVRSQYPEDARIKFHRKTIPDALPLSEADRFAFVHLNTADYKAEALSLPLFFEALSRGGVLVIDNYAIDDGHFDIYDPAMRQIGVEPLWLPSGQCVILKM
jgi:hypothetical protein